MSQQNEIYPGSMMLPESLKANQCNLLLLMIEGEKSGDQLI